jgi:hypothetical protein
MSPSSSAKHVDRAGILSGTASGGGRTLRGTMPLRVLLGFDAVTCVAFGAALVVLNATLARVAGLPPALLYEAGWFLLAFGSFVSWAALRASPPRRAVVAIIVANALWVVASADLLAASLSPTTTIGFVLVAVQAIAVAMLAVLEFLAMRSA